MRILLVRPPVPAYTVGLKHLMICEPLELEYVAAGVRDHEVQIMDMILERNLASRLAEFQPDIVGTGSYITGVNEVKKICAQVKQWNSSCITIVGGVHAACAPEDFIHPCIDCIVTGDGTSIIGDIVAAVENGRPLEEIAGLALPNGNRIRFTAARPYMPNPDLLPLPRRDLISHLQDRYYYLYHQPVALIKTTWGCWYRCNFCFTWRITRGAVFSRSPESIVRELKTIEAEDVYIVDDIFLMHPPRLARLAQLIRSNRIRKKFLVYGRADFIAANEAIIQEWSELGLVAVIIGLEAATDDELAALEKNCTVDCNREAVRVLRKYGVDPYASLITRPEYTAEDWNRLQVFIDHQRIYYINISPLTPLPGTATWDMYGDRITVSRRAHGLWDLSHCLLPTRAPLKEYYRSLIKLYSKTLLDTRRARKDTLRTRPPIWSLKYLRILVGMLLIFVQFWHIHRHHEPAQLTRAMDTRP
jgi:hopanoid C-3 methylase